MPTGRVGNAHQISQVFLKQRKPQSARSIVSSVCMALQPVGNSPRNTKDGHKVIFNI